MIIFTYFLNKSVLPNKKTILTYKLFIFHVSMEPTKYTCDICASLIYRIDVTDRNEPVITLIKTNPNLESCKIAH